MKRYIPALLLLLLLRLAIFQTVEVVKASRSDKNAAEQQPTTEMEQQQWLSEAALAASEEDPLLGPAMQKLKDIQQRYSKSALVNPNKISIVDIPEPLFVEHQTYSWRIHVPETEVVEVLGFLEDADSPEFAARLTAGESKVSVGFFRPSDDSVGNTLPVEQRPDRDRRVQALVNEEVVWKASVPPTDPTDPIDAVSVERSPFRVPTVILNSESSVETFCGSRLHIRLHVIEASGDVQ